MATRTKQFEEWWRRVQLPWWAHGNPSLSPTQHRDIHELCLKAYKLGKKHERFDINNKPRE
jgi:hypothetical protein